ncbi:uncharacterized protein LOC142774718 isoform X2 [Rhipicephalus microplus]|uniref:uncharacterized protein LOC142774718 isoform X2 n=1 Tax=Rhipicephalus microplus TaxID=6941 RepID=UPI003F6AFB8D
MAGETTRRWWDGSWPSAQGHESYEATMSTFQHQASDAAAPSYGHVDQLQCGTTDFWIPTDDTSAFFRLPSTSQNFRMLGPDISGNNARTSGTTSNLGPSMEYYRVDHLPSSFDAYDNGSTGVLNPTFVRRYWEASTSCTDIEQPSSTPEDNPSVPSGTAGLEHSATYEHVPMYQNGEADIPDDFMAAIEATVRGLEINNEYVPLTNSAGGTASSTQ